MMLRCAPCYPWCFKKHSGDVGSTAHFSLSDWLFSVLSLKRCWWNNVLSACSGSKSPCILKESYELPSLSLDGNSRWVTGRVFLQRIQQSPSWSDEGFPLPGSSKPLRAPVTATLMAISILHVIVSCPELAFGTGIRY